MSAETPVAVEPEAPADSGALAQPVLQVEDLQVGFPTYGADTVLALRGIDLAIGAREILGLVGESGSGKTTLARAILHLVPPPGRIERGRVVFRGQDLATRSEAEFRRLRGREIAMVIPNPRGELNPLLPVGRQIADVARYHLGISKDKARAMALDMLREVHIPDPGRRYKAYPHELSGGMAQRVVMAIALICSPAFLISDDATSGLDVTVQAQILDLLRRLVREHDTAMLFITRDIGITAHFCDRVAVINAGEIVEIANRTQFFEDPQHPYTIMLLAAYAHNPRLRAQWTTGAQQQAHETSAAGCAFAPRCVRAQPRCRTDHPDLRMRGDGHAVRCHFPVER